MSTHTAAIVPQAPDSITILKEALEAFSSGDIDRIVDITHPDFEGSVPPELSAEPDTYRGHAGIRRYFATFVDVVEDIRFEPERFWEAAPDVIVASVRMTGRGKQTAIPIEQRNAQVWTLREGKLWRGVTYASLGDALTAAGLSATAPASAE
jgi:ketosteroid isomerase-like protein